MGGVGVVSKVGERRGEEGGSEGEELRRGGGDIWGER